MIVGTFRICNVDLIKLHVCKHFNFWPPQGLRKENQFNRWQTFHYANRTLATPHSVFLSTAKGPYWLSQQLVPGELMGSSWLIPNALIGLKWAQPRDDAAEKSFLAYPSTPMGKKLWIFAIVIGWCIGFIKMRGVAGHTIFFHSVISA